MDDVLEGEAVYSESPTRSLLNSIFMKSVDFNLGTLTVTFLLDRDSEKKKKKKRSSTSETSGRESCLISVRDTY